MKQEWNMLISICNCHFFLPHPSHIDTMSFTAPLQQHGNEKMFPTSQPVTSHVPPMSIQTDCERTIKTPDCYLFLPSTSHPVATSMSVRSFTVGSLLMLVWTCERHVIQKTTVFWIHDRSQLALRPKTVGWVCPVTHRRRRRTQLFRAFTS